MEKLLKIADVKALLGVHQQTVYEWTWRADDPLPVTRLGRSVRIKESDLDAWVARQGSPKPKSTPT